MAICGFSARAHGGLAQQTRCRRVEARLAVRRGEFTFLAHKNMSTYCSVYSDIARIGLADRAHAAPSTLEVAVEVKGGAKRANTAMPPFSMRTGVAFAGLGGVVLHGALRTSTTRGCCKRARVTIRPFWHAGCLRVGWRTVQERSRARERAVCGWAGCKKEEDSEVVLMVRGTSRSRARRDVC